MKEIKTINGHISLVKGTSKKSGKEYIALGIVTDDGISLVSFDRFMIMRVFDLTPKELESLLE